MTDVKLQNMIEELDDLIAWGRTAGEVNPQSAIVFLLDKLKTIVDEYGQDMVGD